MLFYLMILVLQVTVLVLIAGGLHFLFRRRPSVQHFVWLTTILSIGLAIPLQSQIPSLDMQIPVAASLAPPVESNSSFEGGDFPDIVDASEVPPHDVAMTPHTAPDSTSEDVSSSQASVASLISRMTVWHWMAFGYLIVCLALVLRLLAGIFALNRLKASARKSSHSLAGAEIAIEAVAQRTCSRRKVQVLLSDKVQVPMAFGLWRPTVLLPQSFSSWPEEAQQAVLLHEFSHVQRFDAFWDLLTRMVAIVWWLHPAIHCAIHRLRQTRERATDELVLEHGVSPAVYAKQLLEVASQSTRLRRPALYMSCQGDIKNRIEAILESGPSFRKKSWKLKFVVVAGFLILASASIRVSFATTPVQVQEKENVTETKKEPTKPEDVTGRTFYERVQQVDPREQKPTGRTISISGRITDENGDPVPDAIVIWRDASASMVMGNRTINDVLAKTVSDVNGRYSFDQLVVRVDSRFGPFTQLLCVSKNKMGLNHFLYNPDSPGPLGDVDIKITDTVSVKGTVVDPDGNPVADTRVSFSHLSEPGDRYDSQSHFGDRLIKPESTTDQQGRFELPGMPSGYVVALRLSHADYAPGFETMRSSTDHPPFVKYPGGKKAEVADNGATISLKKGVELSGVVTDGDGQPISGVSVSTQWRKCSTDLKGRFSFRGRESAADPEIDLFLRQSKELSRLLRVKQSELKAGTANLRLLKPGKVTGKVISAKTGRPIEGMSVWFEPKSNDMGRVESTDDNGVFETEVAPGEMSVTLRRGSARVGICNATAEGCEFRNRPVSVGDFPVGTLKVKPGETRELTIRVSVEGSNRVKVLDQNGNPVKGALVGYQSFGGGTDGFVETDVDGMAEVDPPFQLRLPRWLIAKFEDGEKIQFAEQPVPDRFVDKILEMKLRPSIVVSGTVSVQSQPIENAMIKIRRPDGSDPAFTVATVVTDKRGFYSVQVPRGSVKGRLPGYRVQVTSHKIPNSKIFFAVNKAKLVDGQLKADVDLIKGDGKIEGVVVDSKGEPVADSLVEVQHLMMRNPERKEIHPGKLFEATSQFTDSEGRFEFTGLPEGFETIIVAGVDSARRGASVVAVGNQTVKVLVTDVGEESKVRIPLR